MKPILLMGLSLLLMVGCKRDSALSVKEPINGAFGWALGARLPAAFEVQTNSGSLRYVDPRGNVPPFEQVVLDVTGDRTIFAITGTLTKGTTENFQAVEKTLNEAFQKKYPVKKKANENGVNTVYFGDEAREVILAVATQPPTLAVCYRDTDFARRAQAEALTANGRSATGN